MKTQWKIELANNGVIATAVVDDFYDVMKYVLDLYSVFGLKMTECDIDTIIRGCWLAILAPIKMRAVRVRK